MTTSTLLVLLLTTLFASAPAHAAPGLRKIVGIFQARGGERFEVSLREREIILRTNAELSRYGLCGSPIVMKTSVVSSSERFAQAKFSPQAAGCSGMDGPIVVHYNRAITGVDVHLIDVVIRAPRGRDRGQTMRWSLHRVQ